MKASPPQLQIRAARIVVRGVNWLGDAVMSTPALLRLREAYPQAHIALITPTKLAELWRHHPAVDAILDFEPGEGPFAIARRVRAEQCELGLVLPNSFQSTLELWWAGVPVRVGYAGQMRTWLLTRAVAARPGAVQMRKRSARQVRQLVRKGKWDGRNPQFESESRDPQAHHIYQYLHLVAQLGGHPAPIAPQLFVTEAETEAVRDRFRLPSTPDRPIFALNPGAEYGPAKRWPVGQFIAAAREIQTQAHCCWVILGSGHDAALVQQIVAGLEPSPARTEPRTRPDPAVINLAGATSLRELCAVLKASRLLLTNDTGPMHVAAALGTPVVALFGSTSPELTGPGLPGDPRHQILRIRVPCAPCFLRRCPIDFRCLARLEVAEVVSAVLTSWRGSETGHRPPL